MMEPLRIAAFGGFKSIPPKKGGAGSDKFAMELYPRIVRKGHKLTAYCRIYPGDTDTPKYSEYEGVKIISFHTVKSAGFDTIVHSFKATFDIIFKNRADIIHLHSGANSLWALFLKLAGKKVYVSQFAMDWKRSIWPWYAKLYYRFSTFLTAYIPNKVIFDNIYAKDFFEKKFKRQFNFIPYGSELKGFINDTSILDKIGVMSGGYFLFVGRFIPDKGVLLLAQAFQKVKTEKKLILIGGSPTHGAYEEQVRDIVDERIIFPGYIYGNDTNVLMKNAYAYIQPSIIEGLSPVILTVMGLGTPLICSDIPENKFITGENATHFNSGNTESLSEKIEYSLSNIDKMKIKAETGQKDILKRFNWDIITEKYIELFSSR